jgi:hypothetical protein
MKIKFYIKDVTTETELIRYVRKSFDGIDKEFTQVDYRRDKDNPNTFKKVGDPVIISKSDYELIDAKELLLE